MMPIISIGQGRLALTRLYATDGSYYYNVFSPKLRRRMRRTNKRNNTVVGKWLLVYDTIICFWKTKPSEADNAD